MPDEQEIRELRDAVVRHTADIKTLFKDGIKRDALYQSLWDGIDKISNRIWWLITIIIGAQGAVILLLLKDLGV